MKHPQHVPLGLVNSHMDVPEGARLQDKCPKCGEKASKYLYNNNKATHQVRVQCLRMDCKHKYQLWAFRKLHPDGYKKVKISEPEHYVSRVKVCPGCGCSKVKFYGLNNNDAVQARYKCLNPACKKLFTPFGNSRKRKRTLNQEGTTTPGSHVVDYVECFERTLMNYLQGSTSNDHSTMTRMVNLLVYVLRAYDDATQKCHGARERLERLISRMIRRHEFRNVPNASFQEDDQVNHGLQDSTSNDHSPMTRKVDLLEFALRAYYDANQNYCEVRECLERLISGMNQRHEFRNVPNASFQEDDQVNHGSPILRTCDLKLRDPAMPTLRIWQLLEEVMWTVVKPNPTPTFWKGNWVYVLPTPTGLLQQEDPLVHDISTKFVPEDEISHVGK